ncbi:MAG TPA: ABC transporter permease [Silvibacterium sp.]|nr:ABC transporter permease [Silvibacterium sp.]
MDAVARFLRKLGFFIRRGKFDSELEEEMRFHREQQAMQLRLDGMSPEASQHAAHRQFGNETRIHEQSREVVSFRAESVVQDSRFALRQLRKNPGFAVTAVLMLTLGIAACVALFAFVDTALIKPLPYSDPNRLAAVYESIQVFPRSNLSWEDYLDWKKMQKVFSSLDVWTGGGFLLNTPSGVQPVMGARVSAGFFSTLGVTPILGRNFHPGEDTPGAPRTALITYATWQQRYGGRSNIVGQSVTLDGNPTTVIGVLPREFHFAPRGRADFWTPIQELNGCEKRRGCHNLYGVARLKDGVTVETALADMKSIAAQLEKQYPNTNQGQGAAVIPLSEAIVGDVRPIFLVLFSGAALLLLIACVNVSNLLLVRAENRRREMAVRGALGASRARLMLQFFTEALVLVIAGSALGLIAAYGTMHLILRLIPKDILDYVPYLKGMTLNSRVLGFAGIVSLLAVVIFSLAPSLRMSHSNMRADLAEGGRGAAGTVWRRFGSNLVVIELAIAVVLLAGAGLITRSFYSLLHVQMGFVPDHLATLEVEASDKAYGKPEQQIQLVRRIITAFDALPGIQSAATASVLPVSGNGNTTWIRIQGHPYSGEHNEVNERDVTAAYFPTIKSRLISGRYFAETDNATGPKVVVINQALARKYFPGENPIGKKIGDTSLSPDSMREVVGVVDDIREASLDEEIWPAVYHPFEQDSDNYFCVIVRTSQAEQSVLPTLVDTIRRVDPSIGTRNEQTMIQRINDSPAAYIHRSAACLVGGFAVLALVLGVVGLYGVIAYSVSQRTREIGVRMALGAQRGSVYQLILKEAGVLTILGVAAGLACSIAAATFMGKLLFGVRSWDLPTLTSVALLLGISALVASFIPARRAASVNPVEALRAE